MLACSSDDPVTTFEPGTIDATASATAIMYSETVTFTDLSTKVLSRNWSFQGGDPATSSDETVVVTYPSGGSFTAKLTITHVDNTVEIKEFLIEVEGSPDPVIEKLGIFTEAAVIGNIDVSYQVNNQFTIADDVNSFEGSTAKSFIIDGSSDWAMASIKPTAGSVDISEYASGFFNIAVKSDSDGTILFRFQTNSTSNKAIISFNAVDELYGFKRDGEWHKLKIPMADFIANNANIDLTAVSDLLVLRSEGDVRTANNYNFYIDDFLFVKGVIRRKAV